MVTDEEIVEMVRNGIPASRMVQELMEKDPELDTVSKISDRVVKALTRREHESSEGTPVAI